MPAVQLASSNQFQLGNGSGWGHEPAWLYDLVGLLLVSPSLALCRMADVLAQGEETGFRPVHAYRLAAALLESLSDAPAGW